MPPTPSPETLVVAINPASGRGKAKVVGKAVVSRLAAGPHPVDTILSDTGEGLADAIRHRLTMPHQALIVVGGDGTVHTALQVLIDFPDTVLGIVPAGTGNDIARAIGLDQENPLSALDNIRDGLLHGPKRIDLGEAHRGGVTTRFGAVYSAGFDALVNERANQLRFPRGSSRYTVAMLLELAALAPRRYRLTIDGDVIECDALLVAVANAESFGGGMRVVPRARVDDGILQVFILEPLSRWRFVTLYPRVFAGTHVGHPRVTIRDAREVRIEVDDIVGYADGERVGVAPVDIRVRPRILSVLA